MVIVGILTIDNNGNTVVTKGIDDGEYLVWSSYSKNWMLSNHAHAGYALGGDAGGYLTSIEDLLFSTEISNVISLSLLSANSSNCGVNSSLKGYRVGGASSGTSPVSSIEGFDFFPTPSGIATLSATLDAARWGTVGVNSATKGYSLGGVASGWFTTVYDTIEDLVFSSETSTLLGATLDTARGHAAGVGSTTKGFIMGGGVVGTLTNVIDDLTYATEASSGLAATLDSTRYGNTGVNSSTKGYSMGGQSGGSGTAIDDLIFSNDTSQAITATLNNATETACGVNSSTKGYAMATSGTTIEDLIFSNETSQPISETLSVSRTQMEGVQSGSL